MFLRGPPARPGHPYFAGAPLLVAHRGGGALAPENTMAAFEGAVDRWGADMLEMDARLSADGEVMVIHDATVDRTTDGSGAVVNLTAGELSELDAGARFLDPDGKPSFQGKGIRIPRFREVLERFPGIRVNIEAKSPETTGPLLALVREMGAAHRVLVAAGDEPCRAAHHGYEGPTSASRKQLLRMQLLLRMRLAGSHVPDTDAIQPPDVWDGRRIVTPALLAWAHARNLPVHVWTVNEEEDMRRLLAWGVDGIQTDRPDRLARVLHQVTGRPLPAGFTEGEGRE